MNLYITGAPYPQPRPRARAIETPDGGHRAQNYGFKKTHKITLWRHTIAAQLAAANLSPISDPRGIMVSMHFFLARPKSHFRTGRFSHRLKDSAPFAPTGCKTGDVDNFAKAVLDEMNGVAFGDDSEVVCLRVRKSYTTKEQGEPGVAIAAYGLSRERGRESA